MAAIRPGHAGMFMWMSSNGGSMVACSRHRLDIRKIRSLDAVSLQHFALAGGFPVDGPIDGQETVMDLARDLSGDSGHHEAPSTIGIDCCSKPLTVS